MTILSKLGLYGLGALLVGCQGNIQVPVTQKPTATYRYVQPTASSGLFPSTADGQIHYGQVFDWGVLNPSSEYGNSDVVWGAHRSGPVRFGHYFAFGMASINVIPQDFISAHPSWIEYQCDRVTQAKTLEGSLYVIALDFTNPAVRQFLFDTQYEPALAEGYDLDLDNTMADNENGACGHYSTSGQWVQQFNGTQFDPVFASAMISALSDFTQMVHQFDASRAVIIDTQIHPEDIDDAIQLAEAADVAMDETGVTQWGWITPAMWNAQTAMALALVKDGKCVWFIDDEGPGKTPQVVTDAERLYDVANYYLTKGACSYITINAPPGYGYILPHPDADMNLGMPLDDATEQPDGTWVRHFENATVTVNPNTQTATIEAVQ